jgi:integrase
MTREGSATPTVLTNQIAEQYSEHSASVISSTRKGYRFVTRPSGASHHSIIVFDCSNQPHLTLTVFAREAARRVAQGTLRTYLYSILPFFTFIDTNPWQVRTGRKWNDPPELIRQAVTDFLVHRLECIVREHRAGFNLVSQTRDTRSATGLFLSTLKFFYRVMVRIGRYPFDNPLVDSTSVVVAAMEEDFENDKGFPRMPQVSGVESARRKHRLTDSYFKLEGAEWVPQIIDDPEFPSRLLAGGRLVNWKLREECVARILFESGGRISEIVGLMLGDWVNRGMLQEATAFSKGSHFRRIKFFRFSNDTAKLLRLYIDTERRVFDRNSYTLDKYLKLARQKQVDLQTVPLFLTAQRSPLTAKTFRDVYWNPACKAAGIDADIHQARHWYVTCAVRQIYETVPNGAVVERKLRELIEYMKWRNGKETLAAYEHFFDAANHADVQDAIHARMSQSLEDYSKNRRLNSKPLLPSSELLVAPANEASKLEDDFDISFLRKIGGLRDANK